MALSFTVPGEVRGKGRPRFGRSRAGHAIAYTDAKTASYENLVRMAAAAALKGRGPLEGPLALHLRARLVPPPSVSRKARTAMLDGRTFPAKRPDLDNILKAFMDGCNGVAFDDDCQIVQVFATKFYADTAGLDVSITECFPAPAVAEAA